MIEILLHHGLLSETGSELSKLQPGRDPDSVTLGEAWRLIRRGFEPTRSSRDAAGRLLDDMEERFLKAEGGKTLRQWLVAE